MTRNVTAAPAETAEAEEKFEIINPWYRQGDIPAGVLAYVPGRGRILRWSGHGRHGDESYGYAAVDEDLARQPEVLAWPSSEIDRFMGEYQQAHHHRHGGRLAEFEKSPKDAEWERFRAQWPFVSEDLVPRRREVERLFDPGRIHYHTGHDPAIGSSLSYEERAEIRDRHLGGDFGTFGRHEPGRLEDEVAAWLAGLQDQAFRNSYNICRGAGVVRSVYPLARSHKPDMVTAVLTALIPKREAITLMVCAHRNQAP